MPNNWRESDPRYKSLLEPENVFDLAIREHRQLLLKLIKREWAESPADSLTVGLCVGDPNGAEIVTIMRSEFIEAITNLVNFDLKV